MRMMIAWVVTVACLAAPLRAEDTNSTREAFEYDRDHPAVGMWVGNVTTGGGASPFMMAVISRGEQDEWSVRLTVLAGGLVDAACTDISASGSDFAFTMPAAGVRFAGAISDDGQSFDGTVASVAGEAPEDEKQSFALRRTLRPTDLEEPMAFSGELSIQSIGIPMTMVLARTKGGNWVAHLDVPMQRLREFPFIDIAQGEDGTITADLPVPGVASIEVRLDELEQRLTGMFRQSGLEMTVDFTRDMNYSYQELPRPQTPTPPLPYMEREIEAPHPDGFSLGGTLTIPDPEQFGAGPFPVAVLISGSGQQDRNESLMGHEPFFVLADHLTRHGIAVMRYDDRGVGASRVDDMAMVMEATSEDFATDTLAVIEHLKTIAEIDSERIGLIGHSEGGMIAPMVGRMRDDIAFMVLMAGPGVVCRELLLKQSELFLKVAGVDDADIESQRAIRAELFQAVADGADEEHIVELLRRLVEIQKDVDGSPLEGEDVERIMAQASETMVNPWMQYFLAYDPAPALRATTCPVLAVNGTLDLQVWHEQNLDAIQRVMKEAGRDITVIRYEGLNHLFQPAKTGAFSEYVAIETTIDEKVLADIVQWINAKLGEAR